MLKIRLQRVGRIHEPSFRLVLTDSKNSSKSGRFADVLGSYDPRKNTDSLNADRIKELLSQGVSVTPSVHNLLIKHNVISGEKIHVSTHSKPVAPEAVAEATTVPEEAPVAEAPVAEEPAEAPQEPAPEV